MSLKRDSAPIVTIQLIGYVIHFSQYNEIFFFWSIVPLIVYNTYVLF